MKRPHVGVFKGSHRSEGALGGILVSKMHHRICHFEKKEPHFLRRD